MLFFGRALPWCKSRRYTPRMNHARLLVSSLAVLALAGCGNKGPLMLPSAVPETIVELPADAPAMPSTMTAPADIEIPVEPPVAPEGVQPAPETAPVPPVDGGNG